MINADDLRKAMELPQIQIDGVLYTGKLFSFPEAIKARLLERLTAWQKPDVNPEVIEKEVTEVITQMQFKDKDGNLMPVEKFTSLPDKIAQEALVDFFLCQLRGGPKVGPDSSASGSSAT